MPVESYSEIYPNQFILIIQALNIYKNSITIILLTFVSESKDFEGSHCKSRHILKRVEFLRQQSSCNV